LEKKENEKRTKKECRITQVGYEKGQQPQEKGGTTREGQSGQSSVVPNLRKKNKEREEGRSIPIQHLYLITKKGIIRSKKANTKKNKSKKGGTTARHKKRETTQGEM